jgi:helicase SWR1
MLFQNSQEQVEWLFEKYDEFLFVTDKIFTLPVKLTKTPFTYKNITEENLHIDYGKQISAKPFLRNIHPIAKRRELIFPLSKNIIYDSGKLFRMITLLKDLKANGHKALIFTQMSKMLDVPFISKKKPIGP